ncbi:hypothetical protein [Klebsiella aerogenes]|uniref:hypothetical protein n=1 Tax=Klebsiella aerogenes TaxID=548 RepID=UPI0013A63435|nr:hypothetical protein [Klebsiella aerogenes]HCB2860458.1 hypothetical protein [Klebsiella aerogenes]HCB2865468.1 hypothetical protein [Klebsiella aerogenes]HCB2881677.1 hypothetical protein [Klebsiella aerogenes]HCB3346425.1 hypothetical protein [Klebsiella aerogenes]HCM1812526.1 hypothetical protein [Klebsiella aerogenes]
MHTQTFMEPEQSSRSFSDDELSMLAFGNTPQANACRELLAYRQREQQVSNAWESVSLQPV